MSRFEQEMQKRNVPKLQIRWRITSGMCAKPSPFLGIATIFIFGRRKFLLLTVHETTQVCANLLHVRSRPRKAISWSMVYALI